MEEEPRTIEKHWQQVKEAFTGACETSVWSKKRKHKEWLLRGKWGSEWWRIRRSAFGMMGGPYGDSLKTKIRLFNSSIKNILLYVSDTWKTTKNLLNKLQVFTNYCPRRILNIRWHDKIKNEELWERVKQPAIEVEVKKRKWGWMDRRIPSHTKPCSGTHRVNVVEGDQETPGGGVSQLGWKELDTDCKIWRSWQRTGRGGEILSVANAPYRSYRPKSVSK